MKLDVQKNQTSQLVLEKSGKYLINLNGEGSHAEVLGAFHLKGSEMLDLDVTIMHAAKHTSAETVIKVIVDESARATINGMIIVKKGAQQTNSFLSENVLMLSDKAIAHAQPNLEIEADDVKCSHAATVGRINDEQLFYLRTRGICEHEAKQLISDGFLSDVRSRIQEVKHA